MPYKIFGKVQHYQWGGYEYLPDLLKIKNPEKRPFAEYWLGAHPKAPAEVLENEGKRVSLNEWIARDPKKYLGKKGAQLFPGLPYLFKVLDIRTMLSIQAHPSKETAEKGFKRENEKKIPLDATYRNFRDDNHKPELAVALNELYLLHGFLPQEKLLKRLQEIPEFESLIPIFKEKGYEGLYKKVMFLPQQEVNQMLSPLLKRIMPLFEQEKLDRLNPDFWVCRAVNLGLSDQKKMDRGLFSIYFLNLFKLNSGEGVFQNAGVLHAYLEGRIIEIMANSDNVLRGGLTAKHVDVDQLMANVRFEGIVPQIIRPDVQNGRASFSVPVSDFRLEQIKMKAEDHFKFVVDSAELLFVTEGKVSIQGEQEIKCHRGEAVFFVPGEKYELQSEAEALVFRAFIP